MKIALLTVGAVLVVLGLHWIGQGTGTFIWPANPVMDDHIRWAYFGACAALAGAVLVWYSHSRSS